MSSSPHDNAPQYGGDRPLPPSLTEAAASLARYLRDNCAAMTVGMADRIGMVERAVEREKATPPDAVLARAAVQFLEMTHRAEKAEAELATFRSFFVSAHQISDTMPAAEAVAAAQGIIDRDAGQLARLGQLTPMNVGKVLPMVVDELLRLRGEAESAKGRMASAIAADLDTARDHLQAVVGAAKVACTAMSRAWGLVGTSEQPALDAAQTTLSAAAANARHMVLDRVDPKASAAGGLVDATPAAWFQAEIDRLRKANHDLQEQNWDLQVPDFPQLSLDHLHYAYMPGDWSSQADEWFVYDRLFRNGHRTRLVRVRWRHGPGVSNSAPKSASPVFEGAPKACAFRSSVTGGTRACGKTTATLNLAKSLAEKGHGVVVVFPSNRAAAAYAEAAKPAVTAGPGEERRQGFDVVLFDHSWYEHAIASERQKLADFAVKVWVDDCKALLEGKNAKVVTLNGTCSFRFADPKAPKREPVPVTRPPCTNAGDLLELAWGVIANVSGGDWQLQSPEWHGAAIAWREDWLRWLESRRGGLVDSAIRKVAGDPPQNLVRDPATGALGVKVGIVRDPVTGWTMDELRGQFDQSRAAVRVLAAELCQARQQIAGTKGFAAKEPG